MRPNVAYPALLSFLLRCVLLPALALPLGVCRYRFFQPNTYLIPVVPKLSLHAHPFFVFVFGSDNFLFPSSVRAAVTGVAPAPPPRYTLSFVAFAGRVQYTTACRFSHEIMILDGFLSSPLQGLDMFGVSRWQYSVPGVCTIRRESTREENAEFFSR